MKTFLHNTVGDKNLGRLDFLLKPWLKSELVGPFNGQVFRQRIFLDLINHLTFKAIVETGTFRGTTTVFLAASGLPVYTVEVNPRFYTYAALRLFWQRRRVHTFQGDTRDFLRQLANDENFPTSGALFYLDAHWYQDLPLREELEIIFSTWRDAVVMVDDFQVPGAAYGYDDYGPGKALDMSYLESLRYLQLFAFFPTADPQSETGLRRGSVVLCQDPKVIGVIKGINSLISEVTKVGSLKVQ